MSRFGWWVMTVLALLIAAYAMGVLFMPVMQPPFLQQRFLIVPLAAYLHLGGSGIALAMGAFQHNSRLRSRRIDLHRWMGRTYVVGVLLGGVGALALATISQYGLPTHVGFGLLATLWLFSTGMAYRYIRTGNQAMHRRWMIRSYALTFAAVTLRIYLPLSQVAGIPFEPAYQTISWLCWVPNLVVAEWVILRQRVEALLPQLRPTAVSCLLVSLLGAALAACGGQTAQKSQPPADTETVDSGAPPAAPPLAANPAQEPETPVAEYVVRGVCPYECCKYGNWTLLDGGVLRSEPNPDADSVGQVASGAAVQTDEGAMVLHPPGIAVVVPDTSKPAGLAVGDTVDVITYTGAKVARVRSQGGQESDVGWGALRMMREPLQRWWVHMTDPATGQTGWLQMGGVRSQTVGAPGSCSKNK